MWQTILEIPLWTFSSSYPAVSKNWTNEFAVRHSWGKYIDSFGHCKRCNSSRTVKILFGVARPAEGDAGMVEQVEKEIEVFGDLAVLNLGGQADHYRNLTTKVRSFLEYALQHFRFGLLLKVDTDSFVFMDRFLSMAEQKKLFHPDTNSTNIYGGAFQSGARPDEKSCWQMGRPHLQKADWPRALSQVRQGCRIRTEPPSVQIHCRGPSRPWFRWWWHWLIMEFTLYWILDLSMKRLVHLTNLLIKLPGIVIGYTGG